MSEHEAATTSLLDLLRVPSQDGGRADHKHESPVGLGYGRGRTTKAGR
jgi:hypothetical protein